MQKPRGKVGRELGLDSFSNFLLPPRAEGPEEPRCRNSRMGLESKVW